MVKKEENTKINLAAVKRLSPIPDLWFLICFLLFLILYIRLALAAPTNTNDILRNLVYGQNFWKFGLDIYNYQAIQFWPRNIPGIFLYLGYTYPAVTLLFFALLAKLGLAIGGAKLVFVALAILNTWLIRRITGRNLIALLYWVNPLNLWWAAHEGQFDILMATLMLAAIYFFTCATARGKRWSDFWGYFFIFLGIQAKVFALFLLTYFWRRRLSWAALWGAVLALFCSFPFLARGLYFLAILKKGYLPDVFKPYHWWSIFYFSQRLDLPISLLAIWDNLWIFAVIIILAIWFYRSLAAGKKEDAFSLLPLLTFLIIFESLGSGEPWYLMILPALALTVKPFKRLTILMFLLLFAEGWGLYNLASGYIYSQQNYMWSYMWHL